MVDALYTRYYLFLTNTNNTYQNIELQEIFDCILKLLPDVEQKVIKLLVGLFSSIHVMTFQSDEFVNNMMQQISTLDLYSLDDLLKFINQHIFPTLEEKIREWKKVHERINPYNELETSVCEKNIDFENSETDVSQRYILLKNLLIKELKNIYDPNLYQETKLQLPDIELNVEYLQETMKIIASTSNFSAKLFNKQICYFNRTIILFCHDTFFKVPIEPKHSFGTNLISYFTQKSKSKTLYSTTSLQTSMEIICESLELDHVDDSMYSIYNYFQTD